MANIFIFSHDKELSRALSNLLIKNFYEVTVFSDSGAAINAIREEPCDLVFIDFPRDSRLNQELITSIHCFHDLLPIIVITGNKDIAIAREAVKNGATTYVTRPLNPEALLLTLKIALRQASVLVENLLFRRGLQENENSGLIPKTSDSMLKIYSLAEKLAQTDLMVLIAGEIGTGKKTLAQRIHSQSPRNHCNFCKMDCAALPEKMQEKELFGYICFNDRAEGKTAYFPGVFEKNNGGTVFLDNIEALPLSAQVKVLYLLQKNSVQLIGGGRMVDVDVRLIAGSAVNLKVLTLSGDFCENLYEKLRLAPIELPPLRQRRKEIPELVEHFLKRFGDSNCRPVHISSQALAILCEYNWPGNVAQLKTLLEHLVSSNETGMIGSEELPPELFKQAVDAREWNKIEDEKLDDILPLKQYLQLQERLYMKKVLEHSGGDKNLAAKKLQISLASFYRKIHEDML
ncbi:MAG: sigma-54 dependent transcriptional regulator [Victivallales bacterium]|nr:sigma-54 dependent transcriptional regulator [Victivallales bacterium]